MKKPAWTLAPLLLALCIPSTVAEAQGDPSTQAATSLTTTPTPPPAPPGQMVSETPMPETQEPRKAKAFKPASFAWSLGIGVPIVLDVPRDVVRPGANVFFFGGADFGFFIVGGDLGLQWTPIDLNSAGRRPLTRIYFSAPDIRFQIPNLNVALPYISAAFDMNFWNFAETTVGCGYWYCSTVSVYRFTPGFTGKAGVAFNVKDSGVHIDVAFQYSFTGKGSFFEETGWWLAPVIGVLVRQ
jgi:hypothetical protein